MTAAPDSPLATLWCPAPNREPRAEGRAPDMLIIHYTGMESAEAALDWLTREESKVSCHYLIDEAGRVTQMVRESERAWHAGQSLWAGETDLNSCSIGIEIHNPGHDFDYPDFPEVQMRAVAALARDENDLVGAQFMDWFLKEQREEVASMSALLAVVERATDNLLLAEEHLSRNPIGDAGVDPTAPPAAGGAL